MFNNKNIKKMFAMLALVAIVLSMMLSVTACKKKKKEVTFDYSTSDLSEYLYVPENLYKNYSVKINIPEITDFDVEEQIVKLLCKNKITPDGPIYSLPNVVISAGDVANIYYRGYTEEDGIKSYFDGGCNFADQYTSLEIGSGTFVPGFESGLIGKSKVGYATMTKVTKGSVESCDIIGITYSVTRADGTSERAKTVLVDLSDSTLDERWGEGFTEYFQNKLIDSNVTIATGEGEDKGLTVPTVCKNTTGTDVYFNIKINVACRVSDGEKLVIPAYFPENYQAEDLRGKTGYFEVYIIDVKDYTTPEFNEEFITGTLKTSSEDLASYAGETLVEKYKAKIKADLNAERDTEVDVAIEEAFWEQIIAGSTFKKLPESEIEKHVKVSIEDLTSIYNNGYSSYYNDFATFARAYLDLSSGADWEAYLRTLAEESVKQRLVFYHIVRNDDVTPPQDKYDELRKEIFDGHVKDYMEYYQLSSSDPANVQIATDYMEENYGEDYWRELVIYDYMMDIIVDRATLI